MCVFRIGRYSCIVNIINYVQVQIQNLHTNRIMVFACVCYWILETKENRTSWQAYTDIIFSPTCRMLNKHTGIICHCGRRTLSLKILPYNFLLRQLTSGYTLENSCFTIRSARRWLGRVKQFRFLSMIILCTCWF